MVGCIQCESAPAGRKVTQLNKIGFSTIGCPTYDVDQVIELAVKNGFQGVEIRHLRGEVDLPTLEELAPSAIAETKKRFDDAGVTVVGIDSSVRFTSLDEGERAAQYESLRANCAIAEGLGASYVRVFGGPFPENQDRERTFDAIVEGLSQAADETHERGVDSLIEMHDDFSTSESIQSLWARGVSKNLGVLWDTHHTYRHSESAEMTWAAVGERVKHVHVKDSRESDSSRGYELLLTGEGTIPIPSFLAVLKEADYQGWVNLEWEKAWHPQLDDAEIAFPHFIKYLETIS